MLILFILYGSAFQLLASVHAEKVLTFDEAFKKLRPLSANSKNEGYRSKDQTFSISLPTAVPQTDRTKEWQYSYVTVFAKNPSRVDQVAVETITCRAPMDLPHQADLKNRITEQVKLVSKTLFDETFGINGDRYFKELGPHLDKAVKVQIKESYSPVKNLRLSRNIYKCDAAGGHGFRFDFILK